MNNQLNYLSELLNFRPFEKIGLAVSGGSDSLAMLFLANSWALNKKIDLYCVTIDHQLRQNSSNEAKYVHKICADLSINHTTLLWDHDYIEKNKIEEMAREARYNLILKWALEYNIKYIFTAHTYDDQIETFLIRLEKGSSQRGLACISKIRTLTQNVKLIRPLLAIKKHELESFLKQKNISWSLDESNFSDDFLRSRVRKRIKLMSIPQIEDIYRNIINNSKKRNNLEKLAVDFLKIHCPINEKFLYAKLPFDLFNNLEKEIQYEIIRRIIFYVGGGLTFRSDKEISKIMKMSEKCYTLARCIIKLMNNQLFIFREQRNLPQLHCSHTYFPKQILWDNRFYIHLPDSLKTNIRITPLCFTNFFALSDAKYNQIDKYAISTLPCIVENGNLLPIAVGEFLKNSAPFCVPKSLDGLYDVFL